MLWDLFILHLHLHVVVIYRKSSYLASYKADYELGLEAWKYAGLPTKRPNHIPTITSQTMNHAAKIPLYKVNISYLRKQLSVIMYECPHF